MKKFLNYFNIFQWKFVICEKKYIFILRSIAEFHWLRNCLMIQIFLYLSGCLILEKYLYNVTRKISQLSFCISIVCITFPSVQWALREITTRWSTNNTREVSKNFFLVDVIMGHCKFLLMSEPVGYPRNDFCRKEEEYILQLVWDCPVVQGNKLQYLEFNVFEI